MYHNETAHTVIKRTFPRPGRDRVLSSYSSVCVCVCAHRRELGCASQKTFRGLGPRVGRPYKKTTPLKKCHEPGLLRFSAYVAEVVKNRFAEALVS